MSDDDLIRLGDAGTIIVLGGSPIGMLERLNALPTVPAPFDPRVAHLNAEALAEIKATLDGKSDQPVQAIMDGLLAELDALPAIDGTTQLTNRKETP